MSTNFFKFSFSNIVFEVFNYVLAIFDFKFDDTFLTEVDCFDHMWSTWNSEASFDSSSVIGDDNLKSEIN